MTDMTTRRLALIGILAAILLAAVAGLALNFALPTQGGAHEIELQGVSGDELAGWGRLLRPDGRLAAVSPHAAVVAASANKLSGDVLETVLVRLVNDSRKPPLDSLAWAVNFDPKTVQAVPAIGPIGANLPRACGGHPEYDVVFIDAQTGELIFELQHVATLPDSDPAATCPPGNYPSPTPVPGQPAAVPVTNP